MAQKTIILASLQILASKVGPTLDKICHERSRAPALTPRHESHNDVTLVNGLQVLPSEAEIVLPLLARTRGQQRKSVVLLILKSVAVDVEEELGRRFVDGPPAGVAVMVVVLGRRPVRQSQEAEQLLLDLLLLALAREPLHHGLVHAVVHVDAAHPQREAHLDELDEAQQEEQRELGHDLLARRRLGKLESTGEWMIRSDQAVRSPSTGQRCPASRRLSGSGESHFSPPHAIR